MLILYLKEKNPEIHLLRMKHGAANLASYHMQEIYDHTD